MVHRAVSFRDFTVIHRGPKSIHWGPKPIHRGPKSIHRGPKPIHRGPKPIENYIKTIKRYKKNLVLLFLHFCTFLLSNKSTIRKERKKKLFYCT